MLISHARTTASIFEAGNNEKWAPLNNNKPDIYSALPCALPCARCSALPPRLSAHSPVSPGLLSLSHLQGGDMPIRGVE